MRSYPWCYNFDRRGHWHHAPGWHKIPPHQDTLAEVLLDDGYYTGMVADAYHMFKPTMNYTRGFVAYDFIRGQESDNWRAGTTDAVTDQIKRHVREPIDWARHATLTQYLMNQGTRAREDDYQAARVFRSACDWLRGGAANTPFFLWIDSFDPHEPWDPPVKYADAYCPDYDGLDFIMPGAMHQEPGPTDLEIERTKALYLGECSFVDHWFGTLMETLDELKLIDDTIIIVLSDHGTEIMDDAEFGKGTNNQRPYNTRIVWYMRHPGGPHGKQIDAYVQSHDLMPTILDLLDIERPMEGMSAWPLVTGETDSQRDHIVGAWALFGQGNASGLVSVRDDRWRYTIVDSDPEAEPELYDLAADPAERTNVASDHPDVLDRQRERVEAVVGKPLPVRHVEVCDPSPSPMGYYMYRRERRK
jgi:arylsulfatase A-like enzyme